MKKVKLTKKSALAWLIALASALTLLPLIATSADSWDGTSDTDWVGDGSEDSPYEISSAAELAGLAERVNAGENFAETYFIQTSSIDLNHQEWTPIGDNPAITSQANINRSFNGNYDGQKYVISNLKISQHKQLVNGLFGALRGNAVLQNIMVEGEFSYIANSSTTSVHEGGIGGIVGYADAETTVSGCVSTIFINVQTLVTGANRNPLNIGGIVGYSKGEVRNCFNEGDFSANYAYRGTASWLGLALRMGGVAGRSDGKIENCYVSNSTIIGNAACQRTSTPANDNRGEVDLGGIVGFVSSPFVAVENCYVASAIAGSALTATVDGTQYTSSASASSRLYVGSIAGRLFSNTSHISNNYYLSGGHPAFGNKHNDATVNNCISFTGYGVLELPSDIGNTDVLLDALNAWVSEKGEDYFEWKQNDEYPVFDIVYIRNVDPATSTDITTTESEPATTTDITTTSEPATTTDITTTSEPATTTDITTASEPATTTDITTTSEPATTTDITTTSEPATTTYITTTPEQTTTPELTTTSQSTVSSEQTTTSQSTVSSEQTTTSQSTVSSEQTTTPETTTTPEATTTPLPKCDDCDRADCSDCSENGKYHALGDVDGEDSVTIFDALEILKYLVGMGNVMDDNSESLRAGIISEEGFEDSEPTVFCALEILKFLVRMDSRVDGIHIHGTPTT